MNKQAVILLSGGMDSAVCAAQAKADGYDLYAITFDYGQRHATEIRLAMQLGEDLAVVRHRIVEIDSSIFGSTPLTDRRLSVPTNRTEEEVASAVPPTYVPARNLLFLSYAVAWAESLGIWEVIIGSTISPYPDNQPEFLRAFEEAAALGTKIGKAKVNAPLLAFKKSGVVQLGRLLGVDFSKTISCYQPELSGKPCGVCDACLTRNAALKV